MPKISRKAILLAALSVMGMSWGSDKAIAKDQSWGAIVDVGQRYQALQNFGGAAVLDRETGLIWEQCPTTAEYVWMNLSAAGAEVDAVSSCSLRDVGGRAGWRLPTFEELLSLGDPGNSPFLPNTSPFCSTASAPPSPAGPFTYWTSTTDVKSSEFALTVSASSSGSGSGRKTAATHRVWCVRGGVSHDHGI